MDSKQLNAKISALDNHDLVKLIFSLNKRWDAYTPDERTVRSELLKEYERRTDGERVDAPMDELDSRVA